MKKKPHGYMIAFGAVCLILASILLFLVWGFISMFSSFFSIELNLGRLACAPCHRRRRIVMRVSDEYFAAEMLSLDLYYLNLLQKGAGAAIQGAHGAMLSSCCACINIPDMLQCGHEYT